ncbi:MAG TPA: SoxY-related AACIE arm protein [Xanthobacteraceae bacterium]|jgi:sulfur-oxidizing protein SoxY|nr:SoxY-related AACIE arm protein [Xanthobacteraceae bacterium]
MEKDATRRDVLVAGLGAGLVAVLTKIEPAAATPATMQRAIRQVVGEAPVRKGKVTIEVPALVENGNTVALAIQVDSPMTEQDHVKAIHVFNEKNPLPNVISARLSPRAGRARIATRFRLADTQTITAIAELSDGSFWSASADVIVTLQACLESLD